MDYRNAFAISAAGMNIERLRLETTAANLANMQTVAPRGTEPLQPTRVRAVPVRFSDVMVAQSNHLSLPQAVVEPMNIAARRVSDPGHPDADQDGYVSLPGTDHLTEMTHLMSALRAYEANVVAMNAARSMAQKALEIGGAS